MECVTWEQGWATGGNKKGLFNSFQKWIIHLEVNTHKSLYACIGDGVILYPPLPNLHLQSSTHVCSLPGESAVSKSHLKKTFSISSSSCPSLPETFCMWSNCTQNPHVLVQSITSCSIYIPKSTNKVQESRADQQLPTLLQSQGSQPTVCLCHSTDPFLALDKQAWRLGLLQSPGGSSSLAGHLRQELIWSRIFRQNSKPIGRMGW